MPFCSECKDKPACKEICKSLEKYLKECQVTEFGGYSDRHYRRKIRLFPNEVLEDIAAKRAFKLKYGKRKGKRPSEE